MQPESEKEAKTNQQNVPTAKDYTEQAASNVKMFQKRKTTKVPKQAI